MEISLMYDIYALKLKITHVKKLRAQLHFLVAVR